MAQQVCPFHAFESYAGVASGDEFGTILYECPLTDGHPSAGPWRWTEVPEPPGIPGLSGVAKEFGLDLELPKIVASFDHRWVEYGVVERAYARQRPQDFAALVVRYDHRSRHEPGTLKYSVSMFLAATLSNLSRAGSVAVRFGPSTGAWSYLGIVSFWAKPPEGAWEKRLTAAESGVDFSYVPGAPST